MSRPLVCSVQMYGGIWAFQAGENDNPYYLTAKEKPSPLGDVFDQDYFHSLLTEQTGRLSAKAFLATEQRIPGLGNGVLQDILFNAHVHPKRKLSTLKESELDDLFFFGQKYVDRYDPEGWPRHGKGSVRPNGGLSDHSE